MPFITKFSNGNGGFVRTLRVRAILALILTGGATWGFFEKIIPYDAYMPLVSMCLGYFFGSATVDDQKALEPPKPTPPVN